MARWRRRTASRRRGQCRSQSTPELKRNQTVVGAVDLEVDVAEASSHWDRLSGLRSSGEWPVLRVSRPVGGIEPGRRVGECLTACSAVTWENANGDGIVPADAMRMNVSD